MQQKYGCPKCHQPIVYGTKSCSNCGAQLTWSKQQQTQLPPKDEIIKSEMGNTGQPEPERTIPGTKETLAKPFWRSAAFYIPFYIFTGLGIFGAISSFFKDWNVFKLIIESIVGLLTGTFVGLISWGIASLVSRFRKRE
ncbi:MAG: zinc-ribbon domain-containing protein [Dehalococcoidia bacterium]|nr:zinc-ribbon domain-containing protein [Dehalococcoidia bacterium]